jgi:hypothetical protein
MLHTDYNRKFSVTKMLVVSLKGLVAKTNWLAVNRQAESNSDSDSSWEIESSFVRRWPVGNWELRISSSVELWKGVWEEMALELGVGNWESSVAEYSTDRKDLSVGSWTTSIVNIRYQETAVEVIAGWRR